MTVALGAMFMVLGAVFEVFDLTACALSSLLVVFVYIEIGSPYTWLVWLATSLVTFVCFPGSVLWAEYLIVFGIYPILKAYIERLPRKFWLIIKLAYINAVIWLLILAFQLIFKMPFFVYNKLWLKIAVYALINFAFVAYDLFITVMLRFYFARLRPRFRNFLK
jgi:hypothetical protein